MLHRSVMWTALSMLAVCALSSCSKPAYLVPGLTLPPGATVVDRVETKLSGSSSLGSTTWGKPRSAVRVTFNCSSSWDLVTQHLDKCLLKAGYKDTSATLGQLAKSGSSENEGLEELNPVMNDPDSGDGSGMITDWLNNTRTYEKQGSNYKVWFENIKALRAAYAKYAPGSPAASGNAGSGDYALHILEY